MARISHNIDENEEVTTDFDPLPDGVYMAHVIESDMVPTKNGTGEMLKLTHEILQEPYVGRRIWTNLNIVNASAEAQKIGRGQLSSLCKACGKIGTVEDSLEVHEIPHLIKLKTEEGKGEYKAKNKIVGYYPKNSPLALTAGMQKVGGVSKKASTETTIDLADEDSIPF